MAIVCHFGGQWAPFNPFYPNGSNLMFHHRPFPMLVCTPILLIMMEMRGFLYFSMFIVVATLQSEVITTISA